MLNIIEVVYKQDRGNENKIYDLISYTKKRSDQIMEIVKDMLELTHYRSGQKRSNFTIKKYQIG